MELVFECKTKEQTQELGFKLGKLCKANMVFTMEGDLGAGKTTMTQGIAKGLGITKTVSSPTFTILKIYQGRIPLYHFDCYRLEGVSHDLGFEEMIDGDGLVCIEWSKYIEDLIGDEYLEICITYLNDQTRQVKLISHGKQYDEMLEVL